MANSILLRSNSITSLEQFPSQISSSALLQKGHLSKHSFDNLKLIKINSSLTDPNQSLEKFNTNQLHLDSKKLNENAPEPAHSNHVSASGDSSSFHGESNSAFWDSLHKVGLTNHLIRNTVSSSNLSAASTSASKHLYTNPKIFTAQQQSKPKEVMYRKNSLPNFSDDNVKNNNNTNNNNNNINNNNNSSDSSAINNESSASSSKVLAPAIDIQLQSHKMQSNGGSATKCSPHQVMLLYMNKLTPFEHHEILRYPE